MNKFENTIVATAILGLVVAFGIAASSWNTVSNEYEEYREVASAELADLDVRIQDAQAAAIEMKNSCNQYLGEEYYGDSGNDQSLKEWTCVRVYWCPQVDWRYKTAHEVCKYETLIEYSEYLPTVSLDGEYCYATSGTDR